MVSMGNTLNPLFFFTILIFSLGNAFALELRVIDPCTGERLIESKVEKNFENVGEA
jgi:hypothetical protein